MNIKNFSKIHFIGIGGVSMSALAMSLHNRGYDVSGSDRSIGGMIDKLRAMGIKVFEGHNADNVLGREAVVYTGAIDSNNPELLSAKKHGIPIFRRTELINVFLKEHSVNIAVSGTHGKTTTSCMCTAIFEKAGLKPDFFIGATVPFYNSTYRLDGSEYLVLEACEYQANFLDFSPSTIIVNNIDYDHVDYYDSIDHVYNTFVKFSNRLVDRGKLIINKDDKYAGKLSELKNIDVFTYSMESESDFTGKNLRLTDRATQIYDFYVSGEKLCEIEMSILGRQNAYNSLGAFAAAYVNGIDVVKVRTALVDIMNALRRFEVLKRKDGAILVSDYAHHPAEIVATIKTAKSIHDKKLIVIFQPHTFTRTKRLLKELSESFYLADIVYIADIDPIREEDIYGISSNDLVKEMKNKGVNVQYLGSLENIKSVISEYMTDGNLIIAMGAGEIDSYARKA